jgi:hypothetical protein
MPILSILPILLTAVLVSANRIWLQKNHCNEEPDGRGAENLLPAIFPEAAWHPEPFLSGRRRYN